MDIATNDTGAEQPSAPSRIVRLAVWLSGIAVGVVAVVMWFMCSFEWTVTVANGLAATGGLVGTTWGAAFVLACVLGTLGLLFGVASWFRRRRELRMIDLLLRPSVSLLFLFVVPAVAMMTMEAAATDVPDILTTTALLGSVGYVWLVLPVALYSLGSWTMSRVKEWMSASPDNAARAGTAVPSLATAVVSVFVAIFTLEGGCNTGESDPNPFEPFAVLGSEQNDAVEETRLVFKGFAEYEEKLLASRLGRSPTDCLHELTVKRTNQGETEYDAGLQRALKTLKDRELAMEATHDAMLKTCTSKKVKTLSNIGGYFNTVLKNTIIDKLDRQSKHRKLLAALRQGAETDPRSVFQPQLPDGPLQEWYERCMARLEDMDRVLVRLYFVETDMDYDAIVDHFETVGTNENARQKISRLATKIRDRCEQPPTVR